MPLLPLICLALLLTSVAVPAEESASEILPRQLQSVERGLLWLAKNQAPDGSWGARGPLEGYRMAMTGLAGLAFLSAGHVPERGPFGPRLERAIRFILKSQRNDGLITTPNDNQSMYGHGFAMTFLAEAYGMDLSSELSGSIRECLVKAVKLTDRAQSSWGGWYYSPNSSTDEGSVTITQVQALRACANVGIPVSPKTMRSALQYIQKSQNSDGGVRYTARSPGGSSVALSAAGAELMLMGGQYEGKETKRIAEYLKLNLNSDASQGYHDMYTNFYGTQAMIQIGGASWEKYYRPLRRRLLNSQSSDGSWTGDIGTTYCTAIAVMILSSPYTYLPIFQK
jgi:squalene cyclase